MTIAEIAIVVGVFLVVVLAVQLMHKYWPSKKRKEHNDVAGFIFAAVAVLYAVLLAFVVIVGWESLASARTITYTEADQLGNIYYLSRFLPLPQGGAIDRLTVEYAHVVVDDEWPLMDKDESSPQAQALVYQIRNDVFGFTPRTGQQQALYDQELASVNAFSAARRDRLVTMSEAIPAPLWVVLIAGGVITVGFCLLFGLESKTAYTGMVAALAVLITLSLILVKNMQYPYAGTIRIGPEAFEVFLKYHD
jgi:Protein of unknown function (DUF4239)